MSKEKRADRAWELDFLRGLALILMLTMHLGWDLRYEFRLDTADFLESNWYYFWIHPLNLVLFVGVAGVCCAFSRNNLKRGLKLLAASLAFNLGTFLATKYFGIDCLIIFNVLHVLTVSVFLYCLIVFLEEKAGLKSEAVSAVMLLAGLTVILMGPYIGTLEGLEEMWFLYPLGVRIGNVPAQADYLPLFPWLGVFLAGAVAGRTLYKEKKTLFPVENKILKGICAPVEFMGRHSLIIYIVHQPLLYGLCYLFFG